MLFTQVLGAVAKENIRRPQRERVRASCAHARERRRLARSQSNVSPRAIPSNPESHDPGTFALRASLFVQFRGATRGTINYRHYGNVRSSVPPSGFITARHEDLMPAA